MEPELPSSNDSESPQSPKTKRVHAIRSRPILALFLIVFVDVLAFTLVLPYLPFYAEHFGASPTQVGLIITVFAFCQFLAGPVLGKLSDRVGRKPVLIISQIGTCFGFVVLALAQQLWMVYLARIIDGITAGNITVAQAAMSDVTKPHERAKAFSLIGIAFGLGFFVGPAIAGILSHLGYQAPAWGAAFFSLCSILATHFFFEDAPHIKAEKQKFKFTMQDLLLAFDFRPILYYLKQKNLRSYLLQFFFFSLSFSSQISGFALFAERRLMFQGHPFGPTEVGYLYAYLGLLGIGIRSALLERLVKKYGEKTTSRIGFVFQGMGYLGYAFVTDLPGAVIASTIASVGSGLIRPALSALTSHEVGPKEQGVIFGVSQSLGSFASIIAPIMAGMLLEHVSPGAWALFSGFSILIALLI
jgi:DHA1 family tetracycline resistance protein-like MFS transporter